MKTNKITKNKKIHIFLRKKCKKTRLRTQKIEKYEKNTNILTFFKKMQLKKNGKTKNVKFNTKKLKKYVFFDVNFEKILFECF